MGPFTEFVPNENIGKKYEEFVPNEKFFENLSYNSFKPSKKFQPPVNEFVPNENFQNLSSTKKDQNDFTPKWKAAANQQYNQNQNFGPNQYSSMQDEYYANTQNPMFQFMMEQMQKMQIQAYQAGIEYQQQQSQRNNFKQTPHSNYQNIPLNKENGSRDDAIPRDENQKQWEKYKNQQNKEDKN